MDGAAETLLDEAMPRWDVHECHQRVARGTQLATERGIARRAEAAGG